RLGLANGKTPEEVETKLLTIVPKKFANKAGSLLLLHGRYICLAQKPKCSICPLNKICTYKFKTTCIANL
ncbi:MAG: endonuclease III, partial [Gammaproteobacteria bacterium]|nr:endonuclease III [Gammaproteobacteria bacterium]